MKDNFKILIVDDIESNIFTLKCLIENYFQDIEIFEAQNYIQALTAVLTEKPNLIFLDIQMPEKNGFEVAELIKSDEESKDIPIIFVTAHYKDKTFIEKGYALGAVDYLSKPINDAELINKVKLHYSFYEKNKSVRDELEKTKKEAIIDSLSGLYNRKYFDFIIVDLMENFKSRLDKPLSILMMDIDNFKSINDGYGHLVGDRVIKGVADIIKDTMRNTDIAARYGGEEFAVLLPSADKDGAMIAAEKIRKGIENSRILDNQKVTVSIGLTEMQKKDNKESFIGRADNALYHSKKNGKNVVTGW